MELTASIIVPFLLRIRMTMRMLAGAAVNQDFGLKNNKKTEAAVSLEIASVQCGQPL
jgi:hypothetical protein